MNTIETSVGPIRKVGTWTISLAVERVEGGSRAARITAYAIAARVGSDDATRSFDVRVIERGSRVVIDVEVGEDSDFAIAADALARAASSVRTRAVWG